MRRLYWTIFSKLKVKLTQTSESRLSASPFITQNQINQQKTLMADFNIQDRWHWKIPLRTKNLPKVTHHNLDLKAFHALGTNFIHIITQKFQNNSLSSSKISLSKQECVIFKGTVSNEESSTQLVFTISCLQCKVKDVGADFIKLFSKRARQAHRKGSSKGQTVSCSH